MPGKMVVSVRMNSFGGFLGLSVRLGRHFVHLLGPSTYQIVCAMPAMRARMAKTARLAQVESSSLSLGPVLAQIARIQHPLWTHANHVQRTRSP